MGVKVGGRMKQYATTLPEDLASWVRAKRWSASKTWSVSSVIRECVRKCREQEKLPVETIRAYQSMNEEEIRNYVERAVYGNFSGRTNIKLDSKDAHRVLVDLDHARAHRDLLNMRFQSVWLENTKLRKQVRELEDSVNKWRRRYMAAANPDNPEMR